MINQNIKRIFDQQIKIITDLQKDRKEKLDNKVDQALKLLVKDSPDALKVLYEIKWDTNKHSELMAKENEDIANLKKDCDYFIEILADED